MRRTWFAALALAALAVGCGSSENYAPVSGRVTLNGQPLANAYVSFQPIGSVENPNPGRASFGTTNAEGKFTLRVAGFDDEAAVVGKHRVAISAYTGQTATEESTSTARNVLPDRYNVSSELTFEVPRRGTTAADFELSYP